MLQIFCRSNLLVRVMSVHFVELLRHLRASLFYIAISRDVTAAILVFQDKETAAILVYQTSPLGVKLYFYGKILFCLSKPKWRLVT